jgi:hypothetical protein
MQPFVKKVYLTHNNEQKERKQRNQYIKGTDIVQRAGFEIDLRNPKSRIFEVN